MKNFKNYKRNKILLENSNVYDPKYEHDACGVGLVATTNGKKTRQIVEYGIEALKAVWHRGAVDADGKSGDGAGIQLEISLDFLPSVDAITPTPQASCSISSEYTWLFFNNSLFLK